jgi:hypothetical protein
MALTNFMANYSGVSRNSLIIGQQIDKGVSYITYAYIVRQADNRNLQIKIN